MPTISTNSSEQTTQIQPQTQGKNEGSRVLPWLLGKKSKAKSVNEKGKDKGKDIAVTGPLAELPGQPNLTLAGLTSSSSSPINNAVATPTDHPQQAQPQQIEVQTQPQTQPQQWQGIPAADLLSSNTGQLTAQFLANLTPDHVMALLYPVLNEQRERQLAFLQAKLAKLIANLSELQRRIDEVIRQSESGANNW